MKVAIVSESSADEAALRILVDAILGEKTQVVVPRVVRSRGWPAVLTGVPGVIKELHFNRDVDLLVLVADANGSTPHEQSHETTPILSSDCRLCELRTAVAKNISGLTPVPNKSPLHVAIGLAVPAIEAWLLCHKNPKLGEANWRSKRKSQPGSRKTRLDLKKELYGVERPGLTLETQVMVQRATELSSQLDLLEKRFPGGFGHLVRSLRSP